MSSFYEQAARTQGFYISSTFLPPPVQIWKQFGFLPEFYNVPQSDVSAKREGYPLRPEFVESAMYLYRATGDPFLIALGEDVLRSIQGRMKAGVGISFLYMHK